MQPSEGAGPSIFVKWFNVNDSTLVWCIARAETAHRAASPRCARCVSCWSKEWMQPDILMSHSRTCNGQGIALT